MTAAVKGFVPPVMEPTRIYVMILGDKGCGKSSLLLAFTGSQKSYIPIVFDIRAEDIKVDGEEVRLVLQGKWNNADDHMTCGSLYTGSNVVLLCFSIDNRATFDNIPENWVSFVCTTYPNAPFILVGNKKDLRSDPTTHLKTSHVTPEEGRAMADSISASGYVECSAMTVDEVRVFKQVFMCAASFLSFGLGMMKTSRVRVLVVGGNKCGKKSLLHTFTRNQAIDPNRPSSVVFDPKVVDIEVDGKQVELLLQGTWSDAKDHVTCRHLYKDTNIVLMCFSIDNRATLDNIPQHWVNFVHSLYPNVPVVLVGNKKDLRTDPRTPQMTSGVSPEEGRAMADGISAADYVECSAMTVDDVRVVFETAARAVLENELSTYERCGVL